MFASICQWGGVRLPTQDADAVVANLHRAAQRNAQQPAAMNSAWTKLYAMFYPDDFVIYDSRVATALVAIAETVLEDAELQGFKAQYPSLGVAVVGRGQPVPCGATLTCHGRRSLMPTVWSRSSYKCSMRGRG
ncbi:hypothetical protein HX882_08005 [Pseudomonas gingeri]|uniref:Uncharacterized protein n=1 Tax=Pseudomonas gingeri TaxID=117681 RepID=A0A7Y7X9M3_9PSED|nr:hypothetical protein [Pseudomonas gingeri]NWB95825.1 hypothetical protein [Pseudomonas gingeri]